MVHTIASSMEGSKFRPMLDVYGLWGEDGVLIFPHLPALTEVYWWSNEKRSIPSVAMLNNQAEASSH